VGTFTTAPTRPYVTAIIFAADGTFILGIAAFTAAVAAAAAAAAANAGDILVVTGVGRQLGGINA